VERLQRGYACGSLGTQTFELRLDLALTTRSPTVVRRLLGDLAPPSLLQTARRWVADAGPQEPPSGLLTGLTVTAPAVIGRSRSCELVLGDDSVSRRHAMLAREGARIVVIDLGSTNGTFLNGRLVRHAEVQPGDRLQLGEIGIRL